VKSALMVKLSVNRGFTQTKLDESTSFCCEISIIGVICVLVKDGIVYIIIYIKYMITNNIDPTVKGSGFI
jgi:hypothetical protein